MAYCIQAWKLGLHLNNYINALDAKCFTHFDDTNRATYSTTADTNRSRGVSHRLCIHWHFMDIGLIRSNILADICAQQYHRYIGCLFVVFCFDFFQYATRTHDPTSCFFPIKDMSVVFRVDFFQHIILF